jgi:hypothetical protein
MVSLRSAEFLERLTIDACTDFFAAHGITLERKSLRGSSIPPRTTTEDQPDLSSGGLIAFAGTHISGSLLVVGSFAFLASCRPLENSRALAPTSSTDWILIRDWSMEIANQLFGRMRNRLYRQGIALDVKSPTAVSGVPLAISLRARTAPPLQFVAGGKHTVRVWLDANVDAGFEEAIERTPESPSIMPREGDLILF